MIVSPSYESLSLSLFRSVCPHVKDMSCVCVFFLCTNNECVGTANYTYIVSNRPTCWAQVMHLCVYIYIYICIPNTTTTTNNDDNNNTDTNTNNNNNDDKHTNDNNNINN